MKTIGKINIFLYVAVSNFSEKNLILRSALDKILIKIRRNIDFFLWKFGKWTFRYESYEDFSGSNCGDMAIRLSQINLLKNIFPNYHVDVIDIEWGALNDSLIDQINNNGNIFVIGGSGYFHFDKNNRLAKRIFDDAKFFNKIRCPIVSFSTGVNCFLPLSSKFKDNNLSDDEVKVLEHIANRIDILSMRDPFSKEKIGKIIDKSIKVIPDPALFFGKEDVVSNTLKIADRKLLRIGVNLAAHGPNSTALLRYLIRPVGEVLRQLGQSRACQFFYMQHSDSEKFIPELLRRQGVLVEVVYGSPYELIKVYETLDVHISEMLHSAILCTSVGVPSIHLAYDIKGVSFFQMMHLSEYCLIANTLQVADLEKVLDRLIGERREVGDRIVHRKKELRKDMDLFLNNVVELVDKYQR